MAFTYRDFASGSMLTNEIQVLSRKYGCCLIFDAWNMNTPQHQYSVLLVFWYVHHYIFHMSASFMFHAQTWSTMKQVLDCVADSIQTSNVTLFFGAGGRFDCTLNRAPQRTLTDFSSRGPKDKTKQTKKGLMNIMFYKKCFNTPPPPIT